MTHLVSKLVEVEDLDNASIELRIYLKMTYEGCAAKIGGPPENCWPAEDPEFDFDDVYLVLVGGREIKITEEEAVGLIGRDQFDGTVNNAVEAAVEGGI